MVLIFVTNLYGQENKCADKTEVFVSAVMAESSENAVLLDVTIKNKGESRIYFARDPVRVDGSEGPYVSYDDTISKLILESRVFDLDRPSPYADQTRVRLQVLNAGETSTFRVMLNGESTRETVPPVHLAFNRRSFKFAEINQIEIRIGYFLAEQGLDLLHEQRPSMMFKGIDKLTIGQNKGKLLFELQEFATTIIDRIHEP